MISSPLAMRTELDLDTLEIIQFTFAWGLTGLFGLVRGSVTASWSEATGVGHVAAH